MSNNTCHNGGACSDGVGFIIFRRRLAANTDDSLLLWFRDHRRVLLFVHCTHVGVVYVFETAPNANRGNSLSLGVSCLLFLSGESGRLALERSAAGSRYRFYGCKSLMLRNLVRHQQTKWNSRIVRKTVDVYVTPLLVRIKRVRSIAF